MKPNWFVAFPIDAGDWFEPWIARPPQNVRLFAPSDLHITLAFLGGVGESLAGRAWELLRAAPPAATQASFGSVEAFGNPRRPSAYGLTLNEGRAATRATMLRWTNPLRETVGAAPERRSPRPHCTVFRPLRKATRPDRDAARAWAAAKAPPAHRFALSSLGLYTWADDRKKRQFKIVDRLQLINPG